MATADDDDIGCFKFLADELEEAGKDRGEELAATLIVLTQRIRTEALVDEVEDDDPAFHHSLVHVLTGIGNGLADYLYMATMMEAPDISSALLSGIDNWVMTGALESAESIDQVVGGEPSLENDQLQALQERLAKADLPVIGFAKEEMDQQLDAFVKEALSELRDVGSRIGKRVDPVVFEGTVLMALASHIATRIRCLPDVGLAMSRLLEHEMGMASNDAERSSAKGAARRSMDAIMKAMTESARAPKKGQPKPRKTSGGGAPKSSRPKKAPASKTKRR